MCPLQVLGLRPHALPCPSPPPRPLPFLQRDPWRPAPPIPEDARLLILTNSQGRRMFEGIQGSRDAAFAFRALWLPAIADVSGEQTNLALCRVASAEHLAPIAQIASAVVIIHGGVDSVSPQHPSPPQVTAATLLRLAQAFSCPVLIHPVHPLRNRIRWADEVNDYLRSQSHGLPTERIRVLQPYWPGGWSSLHHIDDEIQHISGHTANIGISLTYQWLLGIGASPPSPHTPMLRYITDLRPMD